ncbi:glycine zipper 2TM domain-containing protein [Qipengyuania sp. SS22]|uniref:glycine zipper 2TM domain-containing protein n=1 Tax=Qipengyuania sp. SS22 TaxID=2979461 RepID=UPI0021E57BEB|nr:glycine zipper 2TM domain-containing protein [Qipengyuania sp. SS22]UYH55420.1 glycine zipper 2TM domain-containing protein [Qipengyuania sp. SS22]
MLKSFRNASMAIAAAGLAFAMPASAAPATHMAPGAHAAVIGDMSFEHKRQRSHRHDRSHNRDYRGAQSRPYYMGYDRQYGQPVRNNTRVWRGNDGRYYCKRDNGTTGLLVGAGVGALLGHEIAGSGGDRTLGAILGGAAGALLGRSIDRSSTRCG